MGEQRNPGKSFWCLSRHLMTNSCIPIVLFIARDRTKPMLGETEVVKNR